MTTKWTIDSDQSDVLIKMKNTTIAYLGGETNHFEGFVSLDEDEIEDAEVAFFFRQQYFYLKKKRGISANKKQPSFEQKTFDPV
jgi:hypothetical protein